MEKIELLQELKDNIIKATKVKYICISNDKNTLETEEITEKNQLIDLDEIEIIDDVVNCDTCQLYDYTKTKKNSINGYLESMIVINKLNVNEYKMDIYMKQRDFNSCIEFENNKQYKIILIF